MHKINPFKLKNSSFVYYMFTESYRTFCEQEELDVGKYYLAISNILVSVLLWDFWFSYSLYELFHLSIQYFLLSKGFVWFSFCLLFFFSARDIRTVAVKE